VKRPESREAAVVLLRQKHHDEVLSKYPTSVRAAFACLQEQLVDRVFEKEIDLRPLQYQML